MLISVPVRRRNLLDFLWRHRHCADGEERGRREAYTRADYVEEGGEKHKHPNVAVHPAEGRREAPLPRIGCNGLLGAWATSLHVQAWIKRLHQLNYFFW